MPKMNELLNDLRSTTSMNEKKALLEAVRDNEQIAEAFKLCYDPSLNSNINKIPTPDYAGVDNFETSFEEFKKLFMFLNDRKYTGNAARDLVKVFLEGCDVETQEIYSMILKRNLRCGVTPTTLNKIWENLIVRFEVQLANKYNPDREYGINYWWSSPKLDGIRCCWKDEKLWTRSGKPIIGFDHLEEELRILCEKYNLNFVDGELYSHDIPFSTIQGFVLSNKNFNEEDKKKIKLNVFAVLNLENVYGRTTEMVEQLNEIRNDNFVHLTIIEYREVDNDFDSINDLCKYHVNNGYEGVMLRHPGTVYAWKRDDNLLKFKLFLEDDFVITGFDLGNGKFKNTLGALFVEGVLDGKRIKARVGSGLDDATRNYVWENRDKLLGCKVEVKYQGITDKENADGFYSLRFPVFMKTKEDR